MDLTVRRAAAIFAGAVLLALLVSVPMFATAQTGDIDCADFETQRAAQAQLDRDPSDPNTLDSDSDGVACEGRFLGQQQNLDLGGDPDGATERDVRVDEAPEAPTGIEAGGGYCATHDDC